MKYKFVHIGSDGDLGEFYIRCSIKECSNVYYSRIPNETLCAIKKTIYRIHNNKRINSVVKLPFRTIWAKYIIDPHIVDKINDDDCICFMLSGLQYRFLDNGLLEYLRKEYKKCKIVYSFPDKVELYNKRFKNFNVDKLKMKFDLVTTYNSLDAQKYSLLELPQKLIQYPEIERDSEIAESDVFFVGNEKGRLKAIIDIYEKCKSEGLKCDFWISGVRDEERKYAEDIHYNIKLSYANVLKHVNASKAIVNIVQDGAYGVTCRDFEAVGLNKVLITNCHAIQNTPFFTKEKVIFTDDSPQYSEQIKRGAEHSWTRSDILSTQEWYDWIEHELEALS